MKIQQSATILASIPIAVAYGHESPPDSLRHLLSDSSVDSFCWKVTTDRGFGSTPDSCGEDEDLIGGLCYSKCPVGYSRKGRNCYQDCIDGLKEDGALCTRDDYGLGAPGFNNYDSESKCEESFGRGNCESSDFGTNWFPICAPGYTKEGCCVCIANPIDCEVLGYASEAGNACKRKLIDPVGKTPTACSGNRVYEAGLCYNKCEEGFFGVGDICWSNTPTGYVRCGAGDAETYIECVDVVNSEITTIVDSAFDIATLDIPNVEEVSTENSATGAESITSDSIDAFNALLVEKFKRLLANFEVLAMGDPTTKAAFDAGKDPRITNIMLSDAAGFNNTVDIIRFSGTLANFFNPSGPSGVFADFKLPSCSSQILI